VFIFYIISEMNIIFFNNNIAFFIFKSQSLTCLFFKFIEALIQMKMANLITSPVSQIISENYLKKITSAKLFQYYRKMKLFISLDQSIRLPT